MSEIKYPSRPREVVCFSTIQVQTVQDGIVHLFFGYDVFSKFIMATPGCLKLTNSEIMKQVDLLMRHKDFSKKDIPFTLVMDFGQDLVEELNLIVEPFNGKVIFDTDFIEKEMMPDIDIMMKGMGQGK
jgi:hypothetical protein